METTTHPNKNKSKSASIIKTPTIGLIVALIFFFSTGLFAQSAKELMKAAKGAIAANNYKDAEEKLNQCLSGTGATADAYELRAMCREKLFNYPGAASDWDKALEREPANSEYIDGAARAHFKAANFKKAAELFGVLAALKKNVAEAYAQKARAELYLKNFQKAIDDASISIDDKPGYLAFWVKGVANDSLGKTDAASMDYVQAMSLLPKSKQFKETESKNEFVFVALSAAACGIKREKYSVSLSYLETAGQWNPSDPDVNYYKGRAYLGTKEFEKSINELSRAISISNKRDNYFLSRAEAFIALNKEPEALSDLSSCSLLNPRNHRALYLRSGLLCKADKLSEAQNEIEKATNLNPSNPQYQEELERIKKLVLEKNRERNKPLVKIISPYISKQEKMICGQSDSKIRISGQLADESIISYLKINQSQIEIEKNSSHPKFDVQIDVPEDNRVFISCSDVYGNETQIVYEILRAETDPPVVTITTPSSDAGYIYLAGKSNFSKILIEGIIKDNSLIDEISVNNTIASFSPTKINPDFSLSTDLTGFDSVIVKVKDVFGNMSRTGYRIQRTAGGDDESNPMGKTWIVFIENSNYQNLASLESVKRDVELVKQSMSGYKVDSVVTKRNMTKSGMEKFFSIELRDLLQKNKVNSLMIWYGGHGKVTSSNGYWLPTDAVKSDESTHFPTSVLKTYLNSYKNVKHTLVIADATETGPAFYLAMRDVNPWQCGDWQAGKLRSAQVLVAAAEESRIDGATSFSRAFAKSLKTNPDKCITIDRVSEKVISEVQKVQKQKPKFGNIQDMGDETGTFFFIKK